MHIHTIEDNFDYQVKEILKKMKKDFEQDISKSKDESFSDWLWNNRKDLGTIFYEKVDEYFGIDEMINELDD